jgi:predicted O-methyltransferase YrrM
MLTAAEREAIAELWAEKLAQDALGLPQPQRHRNLEPPSAEFVCALAAGIGAKRLLEIGGSSGLSTIALAVAARQTGGRLVSIEVEPKRQSLAASRLTALSLAGWVDLVLADAADVLAQYEALDFVLVDCEKDDYERFLAQLNLADGAVVVADNVVSHGLTRYVTTVRAYPGVESMTLSIGKGLEVSRFRDGSKSVGSRSTAGA